MTARPLGSAARVERRDHAELAPAPDVGDHRGDVLRRFQLERARLEHLAGVVQFGRTALPVLPDGLLDLGRCLQREVGEVGHGPTICDGRRTRDELTTMAVMAGSADAGRGRSRRCRSPTPTRSSSRNPGVTKLDLIHYYLAVADGALRGVAGRPMILKRFVKGISEEAIFQKRAPEKRPDWIDVAELKYASGTSAKEAVLRDAAGLVWAVNLGCVDLNPASGAGRRPRPPRRTAGGPRPDARRGVAADRRRRAGGPGGARGLRADRVAEDVGLEGLPHLRAHRTRTGRTSRCGWPPRPSPARSNAARPSWRPAGGGRKNAASASSSTSTRTPRTAPSRRPTRCGRGPTPGCRRRCTGTRCPTAGPRRSPWRRCPRASPSIGDPWEGMDDAAGGLDGLLEPREGTRARRRRRRRAGTGTGRRESSMPLIEIARTKTKDEAMAALDTWRRRHPGRGRPARARRRARRRDARAEFDLVPHPDQPAARARGPAAAAGGADRRLLPVGELLRARSGCARPFARRSARFADASS